jgi:hypothetical protein
MGLDWAKARLCFQGPKIVPVPARTVAIALPWNKPRRLISCFGIVLPP